MLDALVNWENRDVTSAAKPSMIDQRLKTGQRTRRPVGYSENAIDDIRTGQMKVLFWDACAPMSQKSVSIRPQNRLDFQHLGRCPRHITPYPQGCKRLPWHNLRRHRP